MSSSANTDRKGGFVQGIPQISTLPFFPPSLPVDVVETPISQRVRVAAENR